VSAHAVGGGAYTSESAHCPATAPILATHPKLIFRQGPYTYTIERTLKEMIEAAKRG